MADAGSLQLGEMLAVELKIDGRVVGDPLSIVAVEVQHRADAIPKAWVSILDGDPALETFENSERAAFAPGAEVEIAVGTVEDLSPVFSGLLTELQISARGRQPGTLTLAAEGFAARLTWGARSREFVETSETDALRTTLKDRDLEARVEGMGNQATTLVQAQQNDWDFLRARAKAVGAVILCNEKAVRIGPPAFGASVLTLVYGSNVDQVTLSLDAGAQPERLEALVWDDSTQEVRTSAATEPLDGPLGAQDIPNAARALGQGADVLRMLRGADPDSLDRRASGQLLRRRLGYLTGQIRIPGTARLAVGDTVTLKGFGARFDGEAWVSAMRHEAEAGTWWTEVELGLRKEPAPPAPSPSATAGLHLAQVLQTYDDPLALGRIKIALPLSETRGTGLWVRLAAPYATQGAGQTFRPEVGDEVVVAFVEADPNAVIVLGALHSSPRAAPVHAAKGNKVKALTTPAGLRLEMDDETGALSLTTPEGQTLSITDETQSITLRDTNDNQIALSSSGIELSAGGDLTLGAKGSIKLDAGAALEMSATSAAALKASGSLKLSSSGTATLKGALVKIN